MKRFTLLITILLLLITGVSCGQNTSNENVNLGGDEAMHHEDKADNNTNTSEASTNYMLEKMGELNYVEFELEVKYNDDKEYEVELEQKNNEVKAKLEDELKSINLKGEEAFNTIYSQASKLTIEQNSDKDVIIKEVLEIFELNPDYNELEVEITFNDGVKIEVQDEK